MLAIDEVVDHAAFERARAIQRDGGDDVFETVGLELLEDFAKARGFELEHAGGVAARNHLVDVGVFLRNEVDVKRLIRGALRVDELDRGLNDRERLKAQKVELDQAGLLGLFHRELADNFAVLAAKTRHVVPQRLFGNHHARGMG